MVFNRYGEFLTTWGEGVFGGAHGIHISPDDYVYTTDVANHTVRKFTLDGKLLLTLGTENQPGKEGEPFNQPTGVAVSPSGEIYVSDGYGQSRVHKYSQDGKLLHSWGTKGDGPGQFHTPHGVWVDRDNRVYVADLLNNRIQIFNYGGKYIDQWTDLLAPTTLFIDPENTVYVPELSILCNDYKPGPPTIRPRISILNTDGRPLARWPLYLSGEGKSDEPGRFIAPHCVWCNSYGDLYVGECFEGQRIQRFRILFDIGLADYGV
jgi:DNA-binding beta-propeller fold protein YncE